AEICHRVADITVPPDDQAHFEIAHVPEDSPRAPPGEVVAVRVERETIEVGGADERPSIIDRDHLAVHEYLIDRGDSRAIVTGCGAPQRKHAHPRMRQESRL